MTEPDLVRLANEVWANPTFERIYAALKSSAAQTPTRISIPTETMEQEFQNYYRRGYAAGKSAIIPAASTTDCNALADQLVGIQEDLASEDDRDALGKAAHYLRKFASLRDSKSEQP